MADEGVSRFGEETSAVSVSRILIPISEFTIAEAPAPASELPADPPVPESKRGFYIRRGARTLTMRPVMISGNGGTATVRDVHTNVPITQLACRPLRRNLCISQPRPN